MRNAIRQVLIDRVPTLEGRVYQPFMPNATTPKPYAVVKFAGERLSELPIAFDKPVQVWLYVEERDFNVLDALQDEVINALRGDIQFASGHVFSLRYVGQAGEDYYDSEWKALSRTLDFTTSIIREGVN